MMMMPWTDVPLAADDRVMPRAMCANNMTAAMMTCPAQHGGSGVMRATFVMPVARFRD